MFDIIAFDADDTLWQNESLFVTTQDRFKRLLSNYHSSEEIEQRLYETEVRNLQHFGYGVKAFTLSMIETAIELTEGRIQGQEIQEILEFGKQMLAAEVSLLEHVAETIPSLARSYDLMVITKGDLLDQENKMARSGLARYFKRVEVLSEKDEDSYRAVLDRHGIAPGRFLMVGNSLKSDILPVIALGGRAVHIPHRLTWAHERAADDGGKVDGYYKLEHIGLLPGLIDSLVQEEYDEEPR